MFNDYMWQTYLNAGGKDVVSMFENNLANKLSPTYVEEVSKLHRGFCASRYLSSFVCNGLREMFKHIQEKSFYYGCYPIIDLPDKSYTTDEIMQTFYDGLSEDGNLKPAQIFEEFSVGLSYYTTFLHIMFPEVFVPYYFLYNFNVLEKIAQEFDIELPPMPIKKNYQDRVLYYGELCLKLTDFRKQNNLSPYELCAFLYDFAPKYIGGTDSYIIKDLPEPKSAFFIGGSKDDIFLADDSDTITCWQCNPETLAGDMVVMYLRTPVSAVNSVWRSVSIGFNDPFFYYYRCTYIANPVAIKQISQKQLQEDKVFKELPIVRKNMQGINGVELRPTEYNHLMDLAKADVPRLKFDVASNTQDCVNEKDVERKLIKPLIAKLGYSEKDYEQYLYIKIGNHNHALIPDFVLLPVVSKGHHSAFAHIEAKHTIPNQKEMEEVKTQARSYAVQLKAKYSVIASKDKVWVSAPDDDFTEDIFSATWQELNNPDIFSHLFKLIGRKAR